MSTSSILDKLFLEIKFKFVKLLILWSIEFSFAANPDLVFEIVSIAVSIDVIADDAFDADDIDIVDPADGVLVGACSTKPISETLSPEIFITSPDVWVNDILPLNVTDAALDIVASVASVWEANRWVAVPEWAITISCPEALVSSKFPSELVAARKSPIDALFIAVITSETLVTLEKSIVLPLIWTWDAVGKFDKSNPKVTKFDADAVTLVEEDKLFIAIAFDAADDEDDAPIEMSFIFISCDVDKAFVDTNPDEIIVSESISLNPKFAKSEILPVLLA